MGTENKTSKGKEHHLRVPKTKGFNSSRSIRWRKMLDPIIIQTIEYLCGPELDLVGYPTLTKFSDPKNDINEKVFNYLLQNYNTFSNWRSDLGDFASDIGLETLRRNLLRDDYICNDSKLIKRIFLSTEIYNQLRRKSKTKFSLLK